LKSNVSLSQISWKEVLLLQTCSCKTARRLRLLISHFLIVIKDIHSLIYVPFNGSELAFLHANMLLRNCTFNHYGCCDIVCGLWE